MDLDGKTLRMAGAAAVDAMELAQIIAEVGKNVRDEERARAVAILLLLRNYMPDCWCPVPRAWGEKRDDVYPVEHCETCKQARAYVAEAEGAEQGEKPCT